MDERGSLKRVPGALAAHVSMRQTVQLVVDEGSQTRQRVVISGPPRVQQRRHLLGRAAHGHSTEAILPACGVSRPVRAFVG